MRTQSSPVWLVILLLGALVILSNFWLCQTDATAEDQTPASPQTATDEPVDFMRDVKPIFQTHCVKCHGPSKQEGGLRLDHRATALRGGDSGSLLTAGKSEESEIYSRISESDVSLRMPPEGKDNKPLSGDQIALIKRWIDEGAKWPDDGSKLQVTSDHWSFQPIQNPTPPSVKNEAWIKNDIDRFVLARLENEGIAPSPATDRYTLIKRLSYDLLGLPPTPEEVDAFVKDQSSDAYEKVVDRMLQSPHFGERWGRHWLDKARYADSDGYEKDRPRPNAWRYRDWVIEAINADMPFDQFTREQLAGDLLPESDAMKHLATAFHRQTLTNTEGGTDQEEFRVAAVIDRLNTTGTVWLGLTVGCAQCHSHKYDPLTQAEYYQLYAFFNNADETNTNVPISEEAVESYQTQKAIHDKLISEQKTKIEARLQELSKTLPEWEAKLKEKIAKEPDSTVAFHDLEVIEAKTQSGAQLTRQEDGSYLVSGKNPDTDVYTILAKVPVTGITGVRLDTLADKRLPAKGPGRVAHGNFVLSEIRVFTDDSQSFQNAKRMDLKTAKSDYAQDGFDPTLALSLKPDPKKGWAVGAEYGKSHWAIFATSEPATVMGAETFLKIELDQQYGRQHTIGRFKLQARTGTEPGAGVPEEIRGILKVEAEKRSKDQAAALLNYYASTDAESRKLKLQLNQLEKRAPQSPNMSVRVLSERANNPRTTRILRRGDFLQPQAEVQTGTPAVLPPLTSRDPQTPPDRLDFANWLMDPKNPLTGRVLANQVWQHLFGQGLVSTMNDFGVRGEEPTHPQLLDHLATKYRELGWSRKALIKSIVMSATYRQSSQHRPDLVETDPQNKLLHRQNRFRVEAEIIRDIFLAASGLLSKKVGGPSVFPPMPSDVAALSYANNFKWATSKGEDRYRRGMYTFFKRTSPYPNLMTFDCPDANTTTVERRSSNTPLMALTTLNNMVFVESAQAMARRVLTEESAGDTERLTRAFRLCVARPPSPEEVQAYQELLTTSRNYYQGNPEAAKQLVGPEPPANIDLREAAAWVATSRIMMNMDEFVTRE